MSDWLIEALPAAQAYRCQHPPSGALITVPYNAVRWVRLRRGVPSQLTEGDRLARGAERDGQWPCRVAHDEEWLDGLSVSGKRGELLVFFFGDSSYSWVKPSMLLDEVTPQCVTGMLSRPRLPRKHKDALLHVRKWLSGEESLQSLARDFSAPVPATLAGTKRSAEESGVGSASNASASASASASGAGGAGEGDDDDQDDQDDGGGGGDGDDGDDWTGESGPLRKRARKKSAKLNSAMEEEHRQAAIALARAKMRREREGRRADRRRRRAEAAHKNAASAADAVVPRPFDPLVLPATAESVTKPTKRQQADGYARLVEATKQGWIKRTVKLRADAETPADNKAGEGELFEYGAVVWVKMSGYAPWPSRVAYYNEVGPVVRDLRKPDEMLVYFFGDETYGWIKTSQVVARALQGKNMSLQQATGTVVADQTADDSGSNGDDMDVVEGASSSEDVPVSATAGGDAGAAATADIKPPPVPTDSQVTDPTMPAAQQSSMNDVLDDESIKGEPGTVGDAAAPASAPASAPESAPESAPASAPESAPASAPASASVAGPLAAAMPSLRIRMAAPITHEQRLVALEEGLQAHLSKTKGKPTARLTRALDEARDFVRNGEHVYEWEQLEEIKRDQAHDAVSDTSDSNEIDDDELDIEEFMQAGATGEIDMAMLTDAASGGTVDADGADSAGKGKNKGKGKGKSKSKGPRGPSKSGAAVAGLKIDLSRSGMLQAAVKGGGGSDDDATDDDVQEDDRISGDGGGGAASSTASGDGAVPVAPKAVVRTGSKLVISVSGLPTSNATVAAPAATPVTSTKFSLPSLMAKSQDGAGNTSASRDGASRTLLTKSGGTKIGLTADLRAAVVAAEAAEKEKKMQKEMARLRAKNRALEEEKAAAESKKQRKADRRRERREKERREKEEKAAKRREELERRRMRERERKVEMSGRVGWGYAEERPFKKEDEREAVRQDRARKSKIKERSKVWVHHQNDLHRRLMIDAEARAMKEHRRLVAQLEREQREREAKEERDREELLAGFVMDMDDDTGNSRDDSAVGGDDDMDIGGGGGAAATTSAGDEDGASDDDDGNEGTSWKRGYEVWEVEREELTGKPLWKRFLESTPQPRGVQGPNPKYILRRLMGVRREQNLPPVFALLSGPTLEEPYRMEEVVLRCGRVSPDERECDLHVSQDGRVVAHHFTIRLNVASGLYELANFGPAGSVRVRCWGETVPRPMPGEGASLPLGHWAEVWLHEVPFVFRVFYVQHPTEFEAQKKAGITNNDVIRTQTYPPGYQPYNGGNDSGGGGGSRSRKNSRPRSSRPTKGGPPKRAPKVRVPIPEGVYVDGDTVVGVPIRRGLVYSTKGLPTYASMIEAALVNLGNEALSLEITSYIQEHFPEIQIRTTWRNSVASQLSTNQLFKSRDYDHNDDEEHGRSKKARRSHRVWFLANPEKSRMDYEDRLSEYY